MDKKINIYIGSKLQQTGGPNSFLKRLIDYSPKKFNFLRHNQIQFNEENKKIIFLLPKTYHLIFYYYIFSKKYPIILRLDGSSILNPGTSNIKNILKALFSDFLTLIYIYFADHIIFQSNYTKDIWNLPIGFFNKDNSIIYNPAPSNLNPGNLNKKIKKVKIICLEGSVQNYLTRKFLDNINPKYYVDIYGQVSKSLKHFYFGKDNIKFHGYQNQKNIFKKVSQNSYIYICLESHPPCPNSVLEMLSLGVPVIGIKSGSLPELVGNSGKLMTIEELKSRSFSRLLNRYINDIEKNYIKFHLMSIERSLIFKESKTLRVYLNTFEKFA